MKHEMPIKEVKRLDEAVTRNIREDLRDIFRSSDDPVAILLAELETKESRSVLPDKVSSEAIAQLRVLKFSDEEDFVDKAMAVLMPALEISSRGKNVLSKQEGREMFAGIDVEAATKLIKANGAEKVYVVGNVGSGKTTFSRELSRAVGFKNIDIDKWYKVFCLEFKRQAKNLNEIIKYILKKENPPFIINHADLLRQDLLGNADMAVYLNPKIEEQLKTRRLRGENDTEGEWKTVTEDEYHKIIKLNSSKFESLGGRLEYNNNESGTSIRVLKK